jgi:serine/threonine kinase 38
MNDNAPTLQQLMKEGKISSKTMERVQIAKSYIEKKYRMKRVQEEEKKKDWDVFNKKMEELNLSSKEKEIIKKDVIKKEAEILRQG